MTRSCASGSAAWRRSAAGSGYRRLGILLEREGVRMNIRRQAGERTFANPARGGFSPLVQVPEPDVCARRTVDLTALFGVSLA